ncbi:MAG: LacI family DNA-binding transcriptional regulator [Eubacteriales bacterium]|jgi:LacI family transcriptional regulator
MKLIDIAKEAKVSVSTVSRVINNSANVKPEKRERVNAVLRKYEYIPNSIARSLVSNSTRTIGILTPDIRHINCSTIAYTVERTMSRQGYDTLLCNTGLELSEQIRFLKGMSSRKVDGLVLIGVSYSCSEVEETLNRYFPETPIVMLNSNLQAPNIVHVFGGMDRATVELTEYLCSLGHRKVAFIKEANSWVQDIKAQAFLQVMKQHGSDLPQRYVFTLHPGLDDSQTIVEYLEKEVQDYTAVMANSDVTACGVIKYLKAAGKVIPRDVSVTGYYNTDYAKFCDPALTTIDNKMTTIGETMALALLRYMRGERSQRLLRITPELVVRESTCPINVR